jgi:hypothetical protein
MANIHYDFFQGKADWGLNYWPNNFVETWLSKQEKEEVELWWKMYFLVLALLLMH